MPAIRAAYDDEYTRFYDRPVPGSDVEIMSYAVCVATVADGDPPAPPDAVRHAVRPVAHAARCATPRPAR